MANQLHDSSSIPSVDLDELEAHLRDTIDELNETGLNEEESFWVARLRFGDVHSVQREFQKVNRGILWKHRLLWVSASIIVLMIHLLSSEFTIQKFRKLESSRAMLFAHLHALAISPQTSDQQATLIFQNIIQNPQVDFPIIVTDSQGEIQVWKGYMMPSPDNRSPETMKELGVLLREMDRMNDPITLSTSGESLYSLHYGHTGLIDQIRLGYYLRLGTFLMMFLLLGYIGLRCFDNWRNRGGGEMEPSVET